MSDCVGDLESDGSKRMAVKAERSVITPEPFSGKNSHGRIGLTSSRVLQRLMAGVMNRNWHG